MKVSKREALNVSRLINEVLVSQLSIPFRQIVNDSSFKKYTKSDRPDILISEFEFDGTNEEQFIRNLVAYAEAKDNCPVNSAEWKDAFEQGLKKSALLNLPYFIVTNCKVSIFYNRKNKKEISLNGNPIREFQTLDIFRLIKRKLQDNPDLTNINTSADSISSISEAIFNKKLWELAAVYRGINFKNNSQKIDFTIGFITLEYFEEKQKAENKIDNTKIYWSTCKDSHNAKLVANLCAYINQLEKDEAFSEFKNLIDVIKDCMIGNQKNKSIMSEEDVALIYDIIDRMKPLHGTCFDLFGAVYEMFASSKEKKDFGEYFTRRHYTSIFSKLLLKEERFYTADKNFTILDPACGTGGFLTESFKYLADNYQKTNTLSNEAKVFLSKKVFYGIDIREENVSRARLNMFLVGDGHTNLTDDNSLLPKKRGKEILSQKFDYIVTNPPYGKGVIKAETNSVSSTKHEISFLCKIINLLNEGGNACVIIPDGVLENPTLMKFRQELFEKCIIRAIISLPEFAFSPYTKEKTYAVYFTKKPNGNTKIQSEDVWMYIIDNDGLANSDKRFPTKLRNNRNEWLHDELSGYVNVEGIEKPCLLEERWLRYDDRNLGGTEWIDEKGIKQKKIKAGFVSIEEIKKNKFNLLSEHYLRNNKLLNEDENGILISNIFNYQGGNPNITEEIIYQHLAIKGNKYIVLSSSVDEENNMGIINLSENEEKIYKLFVDKNGIKISRLGKGGTMQYLDADKYISTDKAYCLWLKSKFIEEYNLNENQQKIFLKLFIKYAQDFVYSFATKSKNASFSITSLIKSKINKALFEKIINETLN